MGFQRPVSDLLLENAGQGRYNLREVFNELRWIVRVGAPYRLLPPEFPP